jgi:hypothetical protein
LSFERDAPPPEPSAPTQTAATPHAPKPAAPAPTVAAIESDRDAAPYKAVPVAELGRYVDHYVRPHEIGQTPREGLLTRVSGGFAHVQRRYGTGIVTIKVRLNGLARAEVMP